ncbi:hypothetical protein [Enterococcus sp. UD-01]|jgi:hypothetical protein|uniref:hypothetical protein n=1 Tax=Enterococcus sp. UD-01 TaxID=3373911 RepID=UPI0038369310
MEKIKFSYIVVFILLIITTGCGQMTKVFDSKEDVRELVIGNLEKKYEKSFEYVPDKKEKLEKYPTKKIYTGYFMPKNNPKEVFFVWISTRDKMKDDYAQYYVKSEAEKNVREWIDKPTITLESLTFAPKGTTERIDSSITLEEYIEKFNPTYEIDAVIKHGLTEDEMISVIQSTMEVLYDKLNNFNIGIKITGEKRYYYTAAFDSEMNNKKSNNLEMIKKAIKEQKEMNELLN